MATPLSILGSLLQLLLGDQGSARVARGEALAELEDDDLLRRLRAGDEAAFQLVLARHAEEIYAFMRRRISDGATAEDLTQETFLRLCAYEGGWQPGTSIRAWLFRVARNLLIDRSRRAEGRHPHTGEDPVMNAVASTQPAADTEAARSELRDRLRSALAALPEAQREVVLLRHDEGLSFPEISEVLGLPVGTLKSRMRQALLHLRGHLPEWEDSRGGSA